MVSGFGVCASRCPPFLKKASEYEVPAEKVSRSTRSIYINFFIFIFIYMVRRKVDRTRIGAGLRGAGA